MLWLDVISKPMKVEKGDGVYRIAVVILHYENIQDTRECLNSLMSQSKKDFYIIVVDNGSQKGRINQIECLYADKENIHFLYSNVNLGFARGNNLGFCYAKNTLHADIVILANNDLIFDQTIFMQKLENIYTKESFDVAGPRIISLVDGINQNPVERAFYSKKDVQKRYIKTFILYLLNIVNMDGLLKKFFAKPIYEFKIDKTKDFQLHGACLIFGKAYVEKHSGLYPGTFMYGEEDILRYQIEKENLKLVYLDGLEVKHKEGASAGTVFKKNKSKRNFYYKWRLDSLHQLIKMMS